MYSFSVQHHLLRVHVVRAIILHYYTVRIVRPRGWLDVLGFFFFLFFFRREDNFIDNTCLRWIRRKPGRAGEGR